MPLEPHVIVAAKMIERNEKQGQLAKELGICRQTLNEKLSGKKPFTLVEVKKLCEHYNLDPALFFNF